MKRVIIILLGIILFISLVNASYFSAEFYIKENGYVIVDGSTDINPEIEEIEFIGNKIIGETQELTSKQGGVWDFALNFGDYESIDIIIHFPDEVKSITNIQTQLENSVNFGDEVSISILDNNKPIALSVDYEIESSNSSLDYLFYIILVLVIIALISYILLKKRNTLKKMDVLMPLLNENEEKIVNLLMKKPMRQKEIRKQLEIPKASFARYMINLEKKKIITREGEGKNKIVRLK